jgi:cytidine deaminase
MNFILEQPPEIIKSNWLVLNRLLEDAKAFAQPEVSGFRVAALLIGESGHGYIGVNLEFKGLSISETVHAEQYAVVLARARQEEKLTQIVVSEFPCGHCRQFLLELNQPDLRITIANAHQYLETTLAELLPHPFTLSASRHNILTSSVMMFKHASSNYSDVEKFAIKAASKSYVPYTQSWSGLAFQYEDNHLISAGLLESAAYNPSLPAMQSVLILSHAHHKLGETPIAACYAERKHAAFSYQERTLTVLKALYPDLICTLQVLEPSCL